jgi:hypothetical protein
MQESTYAEQMLLQKPTYASENAGKMTHKGL